MNLKSWARAIIIGAAVAAMSAAPPPARAQNATPANPVDPNNPSPSAPAAQTVQKDLQQLAAVLTDESTKPEDRDEAARRLVSRQSPEARQILLSALVSIGNRNAQLAVANALIDDPHPDPAFITPLFSVLGRDRTLTDAAATALGNYKGNPDVLVRLIAKATSNEWDPIRVACIRALGSLNEKRAAETLIGLLLREDDTVTVRNAAADALVQLTGLRDYGRDAQRWQRWWAANANLSDAEWRLTLLNDRSARLDLAQSRVTQLTDELNAMLTEAYQLTPDAKKPEAVLRWLKSGKPATRTGAAQLVYYDTLANRSIPQAVREQLRKMVGDSSPDVRLQVAETLGALNDAEAMEPLLAQLAQERDPEVKAKIARAIAPIRDLRAVPELIKLLNDPSFVAADAAAGALTSMGPTIRDKDPELATQVAGALRAALDQRSNAPGSGLFREAVVQAMVPLHDRSLQPVFYRLLTTRQPPGIRRFALKGLGELKDPNASDLVINSLDDPEASVRLEAVTALASVGTFENCEALYRRMKESEEADPSVRAEAWRVLQLLLAKDPTPASRVGEWAQQFIKDPPRRVAILQIQANKQKAAGETERLAYTQQNIGAEFMTLGRPAEAVPFFRSALEYWTSKGDERLTAGLVNQFLRAQLGSRQYADAVKYGGQLIQADPGQEQTVGVAIWEEAQRLQKSGKPEDWRNALSLIAEARKMQPPLRRYNNNLTDIEDDLKKRLASDNAPDGTGTGTAPGTGTGRTEPTPGPQSARQERPSAAAAS